MGAAQPVPGVMAAEGGGAHVVAPEDQQGDGDAQEERRRRVRLESNHPVRGVALPALRLLAYILRSTTATPQVCRAWIGRRRTLFLVAICCC